MAIRIQREVGGNLAELLLTVAATLREREYLRRQVKALSAEGRLSCWILGGLPPIFLLYLALTKWSYVNPMFTTPIGWVMLTVLAVLLTVGIFWMSKVSKVDV
jgi:tight adherence protein B